MIRKIADFFTVLSVILYSQKGETELFASLSKGLQFFYLNEYVLIG